MSQKPLCCSSILRERCWRCWRTYVSISFMNVCCDIVDSWWVFRIQEYEEIVRETCRCGLLLLIIWARYDDASWLHESSSRSFDEERSSWVCPKEQLRPLIKTHGRIDDVHEENVCGYEKIERVRGYVVERFLRKKKDRRKSPIPNWTEKKPFIELLVVCSFVNLVVCCLCYVFYVHWSFSLVGLVDWLVVRLFVCVWLWRWLFVWLTWRVCALVCLVCPNLHKTIQCDMNRETSFRHESKLTWTNVRWSFLILLHWGSL